MRKLLLISLSSWLVAAGLAATNLPPLTTTELLDKFAAAQEHLKSFSAWEECSSTGTDGQNYCATESHMDWPSLMAARERHWGARRGPLGQIYTKERPRYYSRITDLRVSLNYERGIRKADGVSVLPAVAHPKVMAEIIYGRSGQDFPGLKDCLGVLYGSRFDLDIRAAPSLRVRPKLEPAGWVPSPCYVIEAETRYGHYTVWLDPAHDFQLARAAVQFRQDHLRFNDQPRQPGENSLRQIEKVRFEQRDGYWLPVECTYSLQEAWFNPQTRRLEHSRGSLHTKLTRFVLNPDHAAQRSFFPDDIREGTGAVVRGELLGTDHYCQGTWQKGRVVDAAGNLLWTSGWLGGMATNQPPQSGRIGGTNKPTKSGKK